MDGKLKIEELKDSPDLFAYFEDAANYPVQLKFGKKSLSVNDKLVLTGRFFG